MKPNLRDPYEEPAITCDADYFKYIRTMPESKYVELSARRTLCLGVILDRGAHKFMKDILATVNHLLTTKEFEGVWTNSSHLPKVHKDQRAIIGSDDVTMCRAVWLATHIVFFWTGSADCKSAIEASMRVGVKRIVIKVDKTGEMVRISAAKPKG